MEEHSFNSMTKAGTMGGTLTVILMNITSSDMLKTAVLSAIGAVVSFGVSLMLRRIARKRKR